MANGGVGDPAGNANLFCYQPVVGRYDELLDEAGNRRPGWESLVDRLNRLGAEGLQRRMEDAEVQIENEGVTYNPYDLAEEASRPWALDLVPLVLPESSWQPLAESLQQRAVLLDMVLRDLYGDQHLLKERLLPPDFLYGHPGFHPTYMQLVNPEKRQLQLYAADLARGPDGQWRVSGDRTRAPFGLGYVLENRIITSRMLPEVFRESKVKRLSQFFLALQRCLVGLSPDGSDNPHIGLWTKGPGSRAYFEDAYLARYLGLTLVQADDLAVRQERVMLKTLGGLVPVDVLFRRLDDELCDPVELDSRSGSGVANLCHVIRQGNVAMANGLGSRLVESPMLQPFLPAICQFLLGEPLKIHSELSWWCGQPAALAEVLNRWETLMFRSAYRMGNQDPVIPSEMSQPQQQQFLAQLKAAPQNFVAMERTLRSTTPAWQGTQVVTWPLALRAFLVSDGPGYQILDGGLARVTPDGMALERSPTSGEKSQDVWITSSEPPVWRSLLQSSEKGIELKRSGSELPSRVADSLFWLGRNVERAEFTLRSMRLAMELLENERADLLQESQLLRGLAELGQLPPDLVVPGIRETLPSMDQSLPVCLWQNDLPMGLASTLKQVRRLGASVRDRISLDAWRVLHNLDQLHEREGRFGPPRLSRALWAADQMLIQLLAFSGLAAESMTRTLGWRFLDFGRRLERGMQTSQLLRSLLQDAQQRSSLDVVLQILDSQMTYRSRYLATLHPVAVCDLLVTDQTNPRSLLFQVQSIVDHVDHFPRDTQVVGLDPLQRLAQSVYHRLVMADPGELMASDSKGQRGQLRELLTRLENQLPKLSDLVSSQFLIHAGLQRHYASGDAQG